MPISLGSRPKDDDVLGLIAAKSYGRAIALLRARLSRGGPNPTLRMQLADVLTLADKKAEALTLLLRLADEYAGEGFAAKAVSVLKKAQRIDPGRPDVESRLAQLIREKQREAAERLPEPDSTLEIGLEMAAVSVPVSAATPPTASVAPRPTLLDLDPDATLPYQAGVQPRLAQAPPELTRGLTGEPRPERAGPKPETATLPGFPAEPLPTLEPEPALASAEAVPVLEAEVTPEAEPEPVPLLEAELVPLAADAAEVEDYDLLYAGEADDTPAAADTTAAARTASQPMSAGEFARELMSLVDTVFQESTTEAPAGEDRPGRRIVVSPLFRDFAVDEMVAVIQGLKLLTVERGEVILREGQPGASLYMITSGRVRAFRMDARGRKQLPLGDLQEGAFFGEMSVLTGRPRMASVVALTRTELLELDRATLDEITRTHPRVWDVLREFAQNRATANLTPTDATNRP